MNHLNVVASPFFLGSGENTKKVFKIKKESSRTLLPLHNTRYMQSRWSVTFCMHYFATRPRSLQNAIKLETNCNFLCDFSNRCVVMVKMRHNVKIQNWQFIMWFFCDMANMRQNLKNLNFSCNLFVWSLRQVRSNGHNATQFEHYTFLVISATGPRSSPKYNNNWASINFWSFQRSLKKYHQFNLTNDHLKW